MSTWKLLPVGALALTICMAPAQAAPGAQAFAPLAAKSQDRAGVTDVRFRGHRRGRFGRGVGIGIGIGLLGGILAAEASRARAGYYEESYDPRVRCAEDFRSFEWDTGRYTTFEGDRRLCPYLR